jgi:hypothetical protein
MLGLVCEQTARELCTLYAYVLLLVQRRLVGVRVLVNRQVVQLAAQGAAPRENAARSDDAA